MKFGVAADAPEQHTTAAADQPDQPDQPPTTSSCRPTTNHLLQTNHLTVSTTHRASPTAAACQLPVVCIQLYHMARAHGHKPCLVIHQLIGASIRSPGGSTRCDFAAWHQRVIPPAAQLLVTWKRAQTRDVGHALRGRAVGQGNDLPVAAPGVS